MQRESGTMRRYVGSPAGWMGCLSMTTDNADYLSSAATAGAAVGRICPERGGEARDGQVRYPRALALTQRGYLASVGLLPLWAAGYRVTGWARVAVLVPQAEGRHTSGGER